MKKFLIVFIGMFLLLTTGIANSAIITLQPGIGGKDSCEYFNYRNYEWNHGDHGYLGIENFVYILGPGTMDSYIEFDFSNLSLTNIQSASLQLYVRSDSTALVSNVYANRVTESWGEMTIMEDNLPGHTTVDQIVNNSPILVDTWVTWDITDMVTNWINGTYDNYGLMLRTYEPMGYEIMLFHSSEFSNAALRPKLIINTDPVPLPGAIILLGSGLLGIIGLKRK